MIFLTFQKDVKFAECGVSPSSFDWSKIRSKEIVSRFLRLHIHSFVYLFLIGFNEFL